MDVLVALDKKTLKQKGGFQPVAVESTHVHAVRYLRGGNLRLHYLKLLEQWRVVVDSVKRLLEDAGPRFPSLNGYRLEPWDL
jgi:hypothetical protein